ncbi:MAG: hypothetical protein AAGJ10_15110 [Bacteroidota bacterium]
MLSLFGCDSTSPDPLLPTRAVFRLAEFNDQGGLVVNVEGDSDLRAPSAVESDTLVLVRGRRYAGRIEFFNAEGENITFALAENADLVEITYTPSGVPPFRFIRTDTEESYDGDLDGIDLPVGLRFEIEIPEDAPSLARGELRVQVLEYAPREKASGGETVLWSDFSLPLIVSRPGPRYPTPIDRVTGIRLRFTTATTTGSASASMGYANQAGLQNGLTTQPSSRFTLPRSGLFVRGYEGALELDGILTGGDVSRRITALIQEEGVWYQMRYTIEGRSSFVGPIFIEDTDADGRPLGLAFRFTESSSGQRELDLRVQVFKYSSADAKGGMDEVPPRTLVDVVVPLFIDT